MHETLDHCEVSVEKAKTIFLVHHVGLLLGWALLATVAMHEGDVVNWCQFVYEQYFS